MVTQQQFAFAPHSVKCTNPKNTSTPAMLEGIRLNSQAKLKFKKNDENNCRIAISLKFAENQSTKKIHASHAHYTSLTRCSQQNTRKKRCPHKAAHIC